MTLLDEAIKLLQELVQNSCVNPPGNEMKSIQSIARYLDTHEIRYEIFESAPNRGNLFAEIEGSEKGPSLMLGPGHVDVVPVEDPSIWAVPPFSGEIKDDYIWGRGTVDMLFMVVSQVIAFTHLWKEGFRPKGDVKLLIVADEEAAGKYGTKWMIENYPDRIKSDYVVSEMGGFRMGEGLFLYQYGEKGGSWLRLTAKGTEQHGSMPYQANNAVEKIGNAIVKLSQYDAPVDTTYVKLLVEGLPIQGVQKRLISSNLTVNKAIEIMAKSNLEQAKLIHALTRMTISPNLVSGGTKVNVVAGEAHVDIDVRSLPGQDREYIHNLLQDALGDLAEDIDIGPVPEDAGSEPSYGNASEIDTPLVTVMGDVLKELVGNDATLVPLLSPGVTDCRFFRLKWNSQAYGFSIFDDRLPMGEVMAMIHGPNERISIGSLDLTLRGYKRIVEQFCS
ncbi:MAG: putative metallohydrolase [Candidatus Thorarchaeota archaeon]|nr:MAG: putative metallohydrolase [Candidatus Thorarchaeota archaeon]